MGHEFSPHVNVSFQKKGEPENDQNGTSEAIKPDETQPKESDNAPEQTKNEPDVTPSADVAEPTKEPTDTPAKEDKLDVTNTEPAPSEVTEPQEPPDVTDASEPPVSGEADAAPPSEGSEAVPEKEDNTNEQTDAPVPTDNAVAAEVPVQEDATTEDTKELAPEGESGDKTVAVPVENESTEANDQPVTVDANEPAAADTTELVTAMEPSDTTEPNAPESSEATTVVNMPDASDTTETSAPPESTEAVNMPDASDANDSTSPDAPNEAPPSYAVIMADDMEKPLVSSITEKIRCRRLEATLKTAQLRINPSTWPERAARGPSIWRTF